MTVHPATMYERRRNQRTPRADDGLRMRPGELRADVARRARDLIGSILRRRGTAGWVLPGEGALMHDLRTSRNAVRGALDLLRGERRIARVRGIGSTAVAQIYSGRCDLLHDAVHNAWQGSAQPHHEVIHSALLEPPPPHLVQELDIPDGSPVFVLERRSVTDGVPIALRTFYIAVARAPGIAQGDLTDDFYRLLDSLGLEVGRSELVIEAAKADERVAELLHTEVDTALLLLENRTWSADGTPLFISFGRLLGDRAALVVSKRPAEHAEMA